jgi:hypothetical protein
LVAFSRHPYSALHMLAAPLHVAPYFQLFASACLWLNEACNVASSPLLMQGVTLARPIMHNQSSVCSAGDKQGYQPAARQSRVFSPAWCQLPSTCKCPHTSVVVCVHAGTLPPSWSTLKLRECYLSNNTLKGPLPGAWSRMVELRELSLGANALTGGGNSGGTH